MNYIFPHNYLIGIDCFFTRQLHLLQESKSIVVSDPAPFPLHINQISTLPLPHLLVKTISQVTIPSRWLAIVPDTFNSILKLNCVYNFTATPFTSEQNIFVVSLLKIFGTKLPVYVLCMIINASPNDVILPKTGISLKWNYSVALKTLCTSHQLMK